VGACPSNGPPGYGTTSLRCLRGSRVAAPGGLALPLSGLDRACCPLRSLVAHLDRALINLPALGEAAFFAYRDRGVPKRIRSPKARYLRKERARGLPSTASPRDSAQHGTSAGNVPSEAAAMIASIKVEGAFADPAGGMTTSDGRGAS
jgi:hypothetical protein